MVPRSGAATLVCPTGGGRSSEWDPNPILRAKPPVRSRTARTHSTMEVYRLELLARDEPLKADETVLCQAMGGVQECIWLRLAARRLDKVCVP